MNHGPIVLSEVGFARITYSEDFEKMMKEQGYTSPFIVQQRVARKLFNKEKKMKENSPVSDDVKTLSIDDWILQRDEYIARQVFKNYGWEAVQWDIKTNHLEHLLEELKPCESADGQCNLLCHHFPCNK